jgi:hypothetical protein
VSAGVAPTLLALSAQLRRAVALPSALALAVTARDDLEAVAALPGSPDDCVKGDGGLVAPGAAGDSDEGDGHGKGKDSAGLMDWARGSDAHSPTPPPLPCCPPCPQQSPPSRLPTW